MFNGCTNLNKVECRARYISATDCTKDWLKDVAAAGTFIAYNSSIAWDAGASGIPSGWTKDYRYN